MSGRENSNRSRNRTGPPHVDQVLTPLGRAPPTTSISTNSVNEDIPTPDLTFDAEQYCSEIKANGNDEKRLEQLVLNAINYFLVTSQRSSPQAADYTVLTFLAWTVSIHAEIFRLSSVLKAMCNLLRGSISTKTTKTPSPMNNGNNTGLSTTPYTLICQILWIAFKDQLSWPDEFIKVYVEDALGEQNWIKSADCKLFVSNIQTAFYTRPSTWNLNRAKLIPINPLSSATAINQSSSTISDTTNNDTNHSNETVTTTNDNEPGIQTKDESMTNNFDNQSIIPRYEKRSQSIQELIRNLLNTINTKTKTNIGNTTSSNASNPPAATSTSTSQLQEFDKLISLLINLCGLPDIRLYILSKLEGWLQIPKLMPLAHTLMTVLCENLTKAPLSNANNTVLTNGHTNTNDTSYIDERAIEQLVNLRFKARTQIGTSQIYTSCISEMLKTDINLVDVIVKFLIHNELQQIPSSLLSTTSASTSTAVSTIVGKTPTNLQLLQTCCQTQPEQTCQSLAYTIQNILLLMNVTTSSKDYDNLLKSIRQIVRDVMRLAKSDFDSMKFCMYLIDMHYSNNLQQQFWSMIQNPDSLSNEITTNRLLKRLLECDMSTRERFLYAICDLIPMVILASAHAFYSSNSNTINRSGSTVRSSSSSTINHEQWLLFIQRVSFIQCSSCLFFLYTLPRLFDSTSTMIPVNYVTCLYSILFTAQVNSYLRVENWPQEEPIGLRNDLFRLSSEIPILGETLYLLIEIGLQAPFRKNSSIIVDLIDLIVRRTLTVEQNMPNDYLSMYLHIPENHCQIFLKQFFDLTHYHIPIPVQLPLNYQIPTNLSITDTFWKTCLICLLLASHDPQVFGRFIWLSVPQIRLFMEMLLTGDYTYPPKSMIETRNFLDKFYMNERIQLREEKDKILELEKYLASPKFIDETNSQLLGKIILLDLEQIKRPSSHEKNEKDFYNLVQGINNRFRLSSMLCRCRSPDFILDILNRKKDQGKTKFDSQTSWLTSLIDSNIDCLNVFPIICLCDYFQHMTMIYNNNKTAMNLPSKRTLHALETILNRFRSIIQSVKQQGSSNKEQSPMKTTQIDDMICILNYFFNCLNSNISTMRSNAWLCLYIILNNVSNSSLNMEHIPWKIEQLKDDSIKSILSTISELKSFDKIQILVKQILSETCQYETNIIFLHYSIKFIIDNCNINSNDDQNLLSNIARAINRRHSILYLLLQYDKQEKQYELIKHFLYFIIHMLINKIQYSLKSPIEIIQSNENDANELSVNTHKYLILPNFNDEQLNIIKQLEKYININDDTYQWTTNTNKLCLQIDSILIELLIIILAYFDFNNNDIKELVNVANLIQKFFLNKTCTPYFITVEQYSQPVVIKQSQEENLIIDNDENKHLKQLSNETNDQPSGNLRKRRLSETKVTEKVFLTSSTKLTYRLISNKNECEESLFNSDDLQYFLFKSNNISLVKQCIDQATFSTCIKMFKNSSVSHENMNYLCQHLNQLLDSSSKQICTHIKQSTLILSLINRWIIERLPEAIKLGEKLKKMLEKKRKFTNQTTQESNQSISDINHKLIPTNSRCSISISDHIHSFNNRINDLCNKNPLNDVSDDNQMDLSDNDIIFPWTNLDQCEQIIRYLFDNKISQIKHRQLLIQIQYLTNQSNEYNSQLFQTIFKCINSNTKQDFLNKLNQHYMSSIVLLNILMKNYMFDEQFSKLLEQLETKADDQLNLFQIKIKDIQRSIQNHIQLKQIKDQYLISETNLNIDQILNMFVNSQSLNDCKIEKQFYRYLKLINLNTNQTKELLLKLLVNAENQLSEPTIGMILDRLEKMDNQSNQLSNESIYVNDLLFCQRSNSSISQRLLLKQFLHSCDWSTILNCIYNLLTLPTKTIFEQLSSNHSNKFQQRLVSTCTLNQSRCSLLNNRDSTLILDMLEAFIKLSPLWSGREFKMLERCHDELLIDLNENHFYTLILYILDEGDHRLLSNKNVYNQYQKRYETIIYYIIKNDEKKILFKRSLEKFLINLDKMLWMKNILTSFYFIIYINQFDLFPENFYFILPNLFSDIKQHFIINTNYDYIIHDLLIRLNSYDLTSTDNSYEINLLLKQYVSKYPLLFLRHLNRIKLDLQSRLSTLRNDELYSRNSKQRAYFLSLFDLIRRLKPYIYDLVYEKDFQIILDLYIRLIIMNLSTFNTCTKQNIIASNYIQDLIYLIDSLLILIYNYLYTTINNSQHYSLFKLYHSKLFEKLQEKMQLNKDLYHYLHSNKTNQILYHLKQLKILYETIKVDELTNGNNIISSNEDNLFDFRLCLTENLSKQCSTDLLRHKFFDMYHYQMKLSIPIDDHTSSVIIDDTLSTLNELKSHVEYHLTIDHMKLILDSLTNYLLSGNRQLIDQTYDIILKYIEKYPQHSSIFYSSYVKCLLSLNSIVFQLAIEHFAHFIIYFQSKANELFYILLKQGFINKIDVTSSLTKAIRLLNLHRYDPIVYTNLTLSSSPSTITTAAAAAAAAVTTNTTATTAITITTNE